jgi:hypothetical protein
MPIVFLIAVARPFPARWVGSRHERHLKLRQRPEALPVAGRARARGPGAAAREAAPRRGALVRVVVDRHGRRAVAIASPLESFGRMRNLRLLRGQRPESATDRRCPRRRGQDRPDQNHRTGWHPRSARRHPRRIDRGDRFPLRVHPGQMAMEVCAATARGGGQPARADAASRSS